jgi:hypothetical protein
MVALFAQLSVSLWQLDVRAWLSRYVNACAEAGGRAPAQATAYLPWNMSKEQRHELMPEPRPAVRGNDSS